MGAKFQAERLWGFGDGGARKGQTQDLISTCNTSFLERKGSGASMRCC